jgi:hypothetical protein
MGNPNAVSSLSLGWYGQMAGYIDIPLVKD